MHWVKSDIHPLTAISRLSKLDLILLVGVITSIVIAFSVQVSQRYLIAGDVWVSLTPAVQIESQRNVYQTFTSFHYPIMFGFILAGLSVCSGLPTVNTYVLLFPLTGLNILTFYVLVRNCFKTSKNVAVLSSFLYAFTGGFGWLFQELIYGGATSFWTLSYLTQDMYFTSQFWNDIMFFYKSLALTLGFAFIVTFAMATKLKEALQKTVMMSLAALFILFSFFIHMVEPIIFIPVAIILSYLSNKKEFYLNFGLFLFVTLLIACFMDLLMSGYYSWLTMYKLSAILSEIGITKFMFYSLALASIGSLIIIFRQYITKHLRKSRISMNLPIKPVIIIILIIIYLSGPYFLVNTPPPTNSITSLTPLPWYYHTSRYGFAGLLALIGIGVTKWREEWFKVAFFWCILALLIGSVWWSYRITGYIFPMIALFAAIGTIAMWKKASTFLHITVATGTNTVRRSIKLNLKPIIVGFSIILVVLSFTSIIYGAAYYMTTGPSLTDDTVKALAWINKNTTQNTTILVPKIYNIYKSVNTIADRQIYLTDNLPVVVDSTSFSNLTRTLYNYNIKYAITTDNSNEQLLLKLPLSYSETVFQSGNIKIHKLVPLNAPSPQHTIAVLDKQLLGLTNTQRFAWADDNFTLGWNFRNVNATTDGEVLTFQWKFTTADPNEPSMKTLVTPINTNTYPYLIIKYRNTQETTMTAEDNIGQIITLVNSTGYPDGFIKNLYLPISKEKTFIVFTAKLPENQNIAQIWLWMRNYKKLNGTIGLQIDYIGLSSTELIPEEPTNLRFLSMAIPALWSTNYTIVSNLTETDNTNILITTYDESVTDYVNNQKINTFIFINATATIPTWGTNWETEQQGVISGDLNGKSILIIGINAIRLNSAEDLSRLATFLYQKATQPA